MEYHWLWKQGVFTEFQAYLAGERKRRTSVLILHCSYQALVAPLVAALFGSLTNKVVICHVVIMWVRFFCRCTVSHADQTILSRGNGNVGACNINLQYTQVYMWSAVNDDVTQEIRITVPLNSSQSKRPLMFPDAKDFKHATAVSCICIACSDMVLEVEVCRINNIGYACGWKLNTIDEGISS